FFLEHLEAEAALDQGLGNKAAVLNAGAEGDEQVVILRLVFDLIDAGGFFEQHLGLDISAIADGDVDASALADLLDSALHIAVEEQLASFDDADLVADVCQLRQDMTGEHDRLVEVAQLLDEAAHFDASAR